jgi:aryl-alcohol dehydrogenase-like predicted oxidoreductase
MFPPMIVPFGPGGRRDWINALLVLKTLAVLKLSRFERENFHRNMKLVERIKTLAAKKGCTPAQLALAWVLAQGDDMVPIPGTKRRQYLEENVGALDIRLTADELAEIDSLIPPGAAAGSRYSEHGMRAVNR